MALNTTVEGLSIEELLRVISNSRLSGILTVIDGFRAGRIVFTWGCVTHASMEGQPRLGELLVERGAITADDLEAALQVQREQERPRPLGTVLSSLGLLETAEIQDYLRQQMKAAFYELMTWTDGVAHLQVDIAAALASVRLDASLDTQALLLEAARNRDEAAGIASGAIGKPEGGVPMPPSEAPAAEAPSEAADDSTIRTASGTFFRPDIDPSEGDWGFGSLLDDVFTPSAPATPSPVKGESPTGDTEESSVST